MKAALVTFLIENQCNFAIVRTHGNQKQQTAWSTHNSDDTVFCKKLFQVTMYVQY